MATIKAYRISSPLVSVVMAVYNEEAYISQAMDSILAQTFSDFELVVVDDGSADATPEILNWYTDNRMRVTRVENGGLTKALNTGIGLARGQFLARMDGDDLCAPERLEMQLQAMQADGDLAMVGTWFNIIDEDGAFLALQTQPASKSVLRGVLATRNPFAHGSVLMRSEAVKAVGGYRPQFRSGQDYDLGLRLSERFSLGMVPQALYSYRLRRGSVGSRGRMLQRSYARTARLCAQQRRRGEPETLPTLPTQRRSAAPRLLGDLLAESTYQAAKATVLLQTQRARAVSPALRSVLWAPWNIVAWAALARTAAAWMLSPSSKGSWSQ